MGPNITQKLLCVLTGLLGMSFPAGAIPSAVKIQDTVVDTQALTLSGGSWGDTINGVSFQQDAVLTHNGWQYVTYYNTSGHVCVARRHLPDGMWEKLELTDYTFAGGNDSHNVISMGICPNDGTIHLSFDHHNHDLNYRVSEENVATDPNGITWGTALFGPVLDYLISDTITSVCYPRFWQTPDGDLQFAFRHGGSGSGDWYITDYSGTTHAWSNYRQVINRSGSYSDVCGSSTSRNAYLNYPGYGPDGVLHVTWCWREGAGGTNHDICYAYSHDGGITWYNNTPPLQQINILTANEVQSQSLLSALWTSAGPQVIGDTSTGQYITVNSEDIVAVQINRQYSLMNQQSQAVDSQGCVHTVMWYATDGAGCNVWASTGKNYHHFWRDISGIWHHFMLPCSVGSRPKLFIRDNGDAFLIFLRSGGVFIAAASAQSQWMNWQEIASDTDYSFAGEGVGDMYRFRDESILSIMAQEGTTLHILDWQLN